MDRRTLLKGLVATSAGLLLPPTLAENVEATRRYWALDRTMVLPRHGYEVWTLDRRHHPYTVFSVQAIPRTALVGAGHTIFPSEQALWRYWMESPYHLGHYLVRVGVRSREAGS